MATRACIKEVAGYFNFGIALAKLLLRHTDNLSSTLQHKDVSAVAEQQVAKDVKTLYSL